MNGRKFSVALLLAGLVGSCAVAWAQAPSSARVETEPLTLTAADRYQVGVALEPARRVVIMAPFDGIVRTLSVPVGANVREGEEIGQFDRAEASAKSDIAQAVVKEMQAALAAAQAASPKSKPVVDQAEARLEAAKARAKLAQLEVDRCTLRAPFAGRVLATMVSAGQYLAKGGEVAEVADVTNLRALVPVDRGTIAVGNEIKLNIEGKTVPAKVQAILPLGRELAVLRELAAPLGGAWVSVANGKGALEPGQRVLSPYLPDGPLASVPARAVKDEAEGAGGTHGGNIQVIRNEYVTDIPVRVLGPTAGERVQVSGALRPNDVLIVASSLPLMAGTLIRFNAGGNGAGGGVEGTAPRPGEVGEMAGITPPSRGRGVAPIGAPGSAIPKASTKPATRPATKPAAPSGGGNVPF